MGAIDDRLSDYRQTRELLERAVLPLATSVDGASFEWQASLHRLDLRRGGYVVLEGESGARLGMVVDLSTDAASAAAQGVAGGEGGVLVRLARGTGVVLDGDGQPFHDASVRLATAAEVGDWFERSRPDRAGLTIGEVRFAPGVPATLDGGGFDRHTFMCGQSGSGKTYSLGVLLERVLMETTLRVVVLDPNSDYVGLGRVRDGADPALLQRYAPAASGVAVWGNNAETADHPLRLRFRDLDQPAQAAVLGLDPVRDRDEYAALLYLLQRQESGRPLVTGPDDLLGSEDPGARMLGTRALNLGVLDWQVWGPDQRSLVDELRAPTSRCTVVDLGSLDTPQEQRLVADAVLATLWGHRMSRRPCLVVVDEAHNICPALATDEVTALSAERAVQIAAEGRKFGLYLLTSTQRPHKVHENVVSQCDNLLLMRMNSQADLIDLGRLLSFVPSGLLAGATAFTKGEALVAGKVVPYATYVRMGERVTVEGGADVPTTWAAPRV
ncbi:ATP-binding protein [Nocardioides sp. MAHUQ-72]|uniref:ATP-binding protein n=1 Tax=unclassified Nocardioides TaxID=2615069 RepID=UPI003620DEED